jgi:hypothetical protein
MPTINPKETLPCKFTLLNSPSVLENVSGVPEEKLNSNIEISYQNKFSPRIIIEDDYT